MAFNQLTGDIPDFSVNPHPGHSFEQPGFVLDISYNCFNVFPGSQVRTNLDRLSGARSEFAIYLPQNSGCVPGLQQQIPPVEYAALVDFFLKMSGPSWDHRGRLERSNRDVVVRSYDLRFFSGQQRHRRDPQRRHRHGTDLYANGLVGSIPESLTRLPNLASLVLSHNQLIGSIRQSRQPCKSRILDLQSTPLSGSIPAALGNLVNLRFMNIDFCLLSGSIPEALGLESLEQLVIRYNQLTGTIPESLGRLAKLKELVLSGNQLSGTIPSSLGDLASILVIFLDDNQLSGAISIPLSNLASLEILDISGNQLSGSLPGSLGNLSALAALRLPTTNSAAVFRRASAAWGIW